MISRRCGNTLIHREGGGAGAEKEALFLHILILHLLSSRTLKLF
jgi:hypothetical protein